MTTQIDNAGTSIPEGATETRIGPRLELQSGPWTGHEFSVPAGGLILGRQGQLAGKVGADLTVSRKHARVYFSGQGQPVIEDLGSANGTFVNGHRVAGATALHDQDVIKLGNIELRFAAPGARPALAAEPDETRKRPEDASPVAPGGRPAPPVSGAPDVPVRPVPLPEPAQKLQQAPEVPPGHAQDRVPPGYAEALAHFNAGDVRTALVLLQACHRHDPGHFGTLYGLGVCHRQLGDRSQARHWLAAARAIDPQHPGVALAIQALDQAPPQPPMQHHLAAGSLRAQQAEPADQRALPGPRRPPTLAHDLDSDAPIDAARLPGKLLWHGHRRLLSHKRLYLGVLALIAAVAAKAHPVIPASYGAPAPAGAVLRGPQFAFLGLAALGLLGAMLNQALTRYEVYERRIDISRGVLFRKRQMIWLYEVMDIELVQSPLLMLAGSGTLILTLQPGSGSAPKSSLTRKEKPNVPQLRAFGPISRLRRMQQELLAIIEVERRSMKKTWI